MELARKLVREMDEHRTISVSRMYAPNEYAIWLSPPDRARYDGVEDELIDELCAYLLEHARREDLTLASHPSSPSTPTSRCRSANSASRRGWCVPTAPARRTAIATPTTGRGSNRLATGLVSPRGCCPPRRRAWADDDLQLIRPPARAARAGSRRPLPPRACCSSRAGAWWSPGRRGDRPQPRLRRGARRCRNLPPSRLHSPRPHGWTIEDLRSTNGVLLNGERLHGPRPLQIGDRIELGTTEIVFEQR